MNPTIQIRNFNRLLESGRDDALLRFSLGSAYFRNRQFEEAIIHLKAAIGHNPDYSAAYKTLAKALQEIADLSAAIQTYENGIEAAQRSGDKQAEKEMQVFLRRLRKNQ